MKLRRLFSSGIAAVILLTLTVECWAITVGELDTFEANLEGWGQGQPPAGSFGVFRVTTGGPAGTGDAFMRIQSGGTGDHGKLNSFNRSAAWTGDYTTAGVSAISMSVNNLGATNLNLRLALGTTNGPSLGGTWFTSTNSIPVFAGSGWIDIEFPLGSSDLSRTSTSGTYADLMGSVFTLRLLHSLSLDDQGLNITAILGVDNILAIGPEPILIGDYNGDEKVSAADYTVWRDTLGSTTDLRANGDDSNSVIDEDDYLVWLNNFGMTLGSGSGSALAAVPEPGTLLLTLVAVIGWMAHRLRAN